MLTSLKECAVLSNGVHLPWLGLGVFRMEEGKEVKDAVKSAIDSGYRSIDTAMIYENETGVGHAIQECGVSREELFITTKLWNSDQGYESTLAAFEESRKKLNLEYIDLYLIHWFVQGKSLDTWKALERLYEEGLVRAIGVSNYQVHHLEEILCNCKVKPMVNQVEFHPYLTQEELRQFCARHQIQLEAWSPLMQGHATKDSTIINLAKKYNKTPAQIVLRWDIQHEVVTIPKSTNPNRILENANVFDFELSTEDMSLLDSLNTNHRFGPDPDTYTKGIR